MNTLRYGLFAVLLMFVHLLPRAVQANDWIRQGDERFTLSAGVFLPAFDTKARVDSLTLGVGDEIDLEDVLGFEEDQTTFYGNVSWRLLQRHHISISYLRFKDESSATALHDIQIGDEIYPVGASLDSGFKFLIYPFSYSYSFIKRENLELAGTLGFHWYRIAFFVEVLQKHPLEIALKGLSPMIEFRKGVFIFTLPNNKLGPVQIGREFNGLHPYNFVLIFFRKFQFDLGVQ